MSDLKVRELQKNNPFHPLYLTYFKDADSEEKFYRALEKFKDDWALALQKKEPSIWFKDGEEDISAHLVLNRKVGPEDTPFDMKPYGKSVILAKIILACLSYAEAKDWDMEAALNWTVGYERKFGHGRNLEKSDIHKVGTRSGDKQGRV